MNGVIFLNYSGILYTLLLVFCFFGKKRINTKEQQIYGYLMIISLFELIFGIIAAYAIYFNMSYIIMSITTKIYYINILIWLFIFTYYSVIISIKNSLQKKIRNILFSILIISIFLIIIFSTEFISEPNMIYGTGLLLNVMYITSLIYIIFCVIAVINGIKKINKKYIPLLIFLGLGVICMFIQFYKPELFLIVPLEVFVTAIMYFTIENPDVKMIEELELARNQADKANKAKTEFLSNMSHEIRTPLNAIVGFSECLIEYPNINEEIKEYAKDIVDASNNLLEIVNGILDISKIEANKMEIIPKDYNPREIFASLEKLILPRIKEKPIEFTSNIATDLPGTLNGDISKLKQIILNLLTNAAKYTDEGKITFKVNCVNNFKTMKCSLFISVSDTGRGIKKESISKLFNKFERLEEDKNTTIEGTGLGLAITQKLVNMLGGKINVFSEYKKGSNFTVYIEQQIVSIEIPKEEKQEETNYEKYKNKKVLIVDDSTINLKVAVQVLKPYNFEIITATSGQEAIEKVKTNIIDLILMDIMMPNMNGVETLKKLKENENFKIPTIALTADAIEGMDQKYINEGFNDYLSKPINKGELNRVINKYLGGK